MGLTGKIIYETRRAGYEFEHRVRVAHSPRQFLLATRELSSHSIIGGYGNVGGTQHPAYLGIGGEF